MLKIIRMNTIYVKRKEFDNDTRCIDLDHLKVLIRCVKYRNKNF